MDKAMSREAKLVVVFEKADKVRSNHSLHLTRGADAPLAGELSRCV